MALDLLGIKTNNLLGIKTPAKRVPLRTPRRAGKNIGVSGTNVFAGQYQELDVDRCLQLPLRWKEYHRMYDDGTITGIVSAISLPIRQAEWHVIPSVKEPTPLEEQIAYDLQQALINGSINWKEFIGQAIRCVFEGITIFEKIWELKDGRVQPVELAVRLPNSIEQWLTDAKGNPTGIEQNVWGDAGFKGEIPIDKLLIFTYDKVGVDPLGRGLFRKIYKAYRNKLDADEISLLGQERAAVGVPIVTTSNTDDTDRYYSFLNDYIQAQKPYGVFPEGAELEIHKGQSADSEWLVKMFKDEMRSAALSQFISFGTDGRGSYALSDDITSFFIESLNAAADLLAGAIQEQLITPYMNWNYPPDTEHPKLTFEIDKRNVTDLITNIGKGIASGALTLTTDIEDLERELLGLQPFAEENVKELPEDNEPAEDSRAYQQRLSQAKDPTIDGSGAWRPFTPLERKYNINKFNSMWDTFISIVEEKLNEQGQLLSDKLLNKIIKYLREYDLSAATKVDYTDADINRIQAAVNDVVDGIADDTVAFFAAGAGLTGIVFSAARKRMLRTLTSKRVRQMASNISSTLKRRIDANTELLDAIFNKGLNETLLDIFKVNAQQDFIDFRRRWMNAISKTVVGNSIHQGIDAVIADDRVVKVVRSEVLDTNTCANCLRYDGKVFDKEYASEIRPPINCLGGSYCRGILLFYTIDDNDIPDSIKPDQLGAMQPNVWNSRTKIGQFNIGDNDA